MQNYSGYKLGYKLENAILISQGCHAAKMRFACEAFLWKERKCWSYIWRVSEFSETPFLPEALRRMNVRFEKTGRLGVQPDRGRRPVLSDVVEDFASLLFKIRWIMLYDVVCCTCSVGVQIHFLCWVGEHSVERTEKNRALFFLTKSIIINIAGHRQREANDLCLNISFLKWMDRGNGRFCGVMRPISTSVEHWTSITVSFGIRKTLVSSNRFHSTDRKLQFNADSRTQFLLLPFFRRGYSQWHRDMHREGQQVLVTFIVPHLQLSWQNYLYERWRASTHWNLCRAVSSSKFH